MKAHQEGPERIINVFVSRATWVGPEFRPGLEAFLRLLESLDLKPRTVGATDFARKSPLDEVIAVMDECIGAVILGFPQINITAGTVKDQVIRSAVLLPTEWNHIEAGLAYARGMPLLVIHHEGVGRGIFDRGAVNSFVYELNLTDIAWPVSAEVQGALRKWKSDVLVSPIERQLGVGPRVGLGVNSASEKGTFEIVDGHVKVLTLLADVGSSFHTAESLARAMAASVEKVRYYLDPLVEQGYVGRRLSVRRPSCYYLRQLGREVLVDKGLL